MPPVGFEPPRGHWDRLIKFVGRGFQVNQLVNFTELITLSLEVIFKVCNWYLILSKKSNAFHDFIGILKDIFQQLTPLYGWYVVRRTINWQGYIADCLV
jgi:hypothetical protein